MHIKHTITTPITAASRLSHLRPGDWVWVWDGVAERNLWMQVAEAVCVEGRMRFRVEGTDFFFDEALIIAHAVNSDREVA